MGVKTLKEIKQEKSGNKLVVENRMLKACLAFTWSAIVFGTVLIGIGYVW